jgi:hypothetical protein
LNSTVNVKLPRLVKTLSAASIRRKSADRYAYENISSVWSFFWGGYVLLKPLNLQ